MASAAESSTSMGKHDSADVLIVGAGPTGLTLAIELLRRGISCRLVDKLSGPKATSRSFTVHARTLELFEHLGLAKSFLADSNVVKGFVFNFKGKDTRPELDFSALDTPYPYILMQSQTDTERKLREYLLEHFGFAPEWGTQVIELSQQLNPSKNSVTVKLKHLSDTYAEILRPKFVVGCDGSNSFVRSAMEIENLSSKYEGMILQLMDTKVHNFQGADDWIHYYMSKDSFFLLSKLSENCHRIVISNMREEIDHSVSQHEFFQQVIRGQLKDVSLGQPEWGSKWQIWKRLAHKYSIGNVFLAGDAAHVHSPSGGQGMNVGIQDAFNLGWKLALAIKGLASSKFLDTYETERQPVAAQVIKGTDAMHDIIMAHGKGMKDRMELTRAPGWHESATSRISGLSYHYRGAVEVPEIFLLPGQLQAGDRLPNRNVPGHGRVLDILKHNYVSVLLIRKAETTESDIRRVRRVIEANFTDLMRLLVVDIEDADDEFLEIYDTLECSHSYILRPDGYVYLRCRLHDLPEAVAFMKKQFLDVDI